VWEFAFWMIAQEPRVPTVQECHGWLGISLAESRRWRNDWLATRKRRITGAQLLDHVAGIGRLRPGGMGPA
jgi:hypothetical protein